MTDGTFALLSWVGLVAFFALLGVLRLAGWI